MCMHNCGHTWLPINCAHQSIHNLRDQCKYTQSDITLVVSHTDACRAAAMSCFQVVIMCHTLAKQKSGPLLVSSSRAAINIMKYADHDRICSDLRSFFGDVRLIDGGADEYTDPAVTGDNTGRVWSLPDCPFLRNIDDIADSILQAYRVKVRVFAPDHNIVVDCL